MRFLAKLRVKTPDPGHQKCRGVCGDGSGAGSDSVDCGAAEIAVGSGGSEVGSERNRHRGAVATLPVMPLWSFMNFWPRIFFLATGAGAGDCDAGAADPSGSGTDSSSSEDEELFRMGG